MKARKNSDYLLKNVPKNGCLKYTVSYFQIMYFKKTWPSWVYEKSPSLSRKGLLQNNYLGKTESP